MRKLILVDGTETAILCRHPIGELARMIGAEMLDSVNLADGVHVMLVDDNGIAKQLPVNRKATALYWEKCGKYNEHQIHGDVVIVPDEDFG